MKALVLEGATLGSLVVRDRPIPVVGGHDVLLRTRAASLNYRDIAIARGEYGAYQRPLILGSDAVGEVVEVGAGVTRFSKGDRVCPTDTPDWIAGPPDERSLSRRLGGPADGVFAEFFAVPESAAVSAPRHLTDVEAATLSSAGVTAWRALFVLGGVVPGDTVVVEGTGGVALFALQLARLANARVVALSRSAAKLDRARALGATDAIDTTATPEWDAEVRRLTGGRGADFVVNVVGGASLGRSIGACRVGGKVIVLGFLDGPTASLDVVSAIRRGVSLHTSTGRSRENFEAMNRAIEAAAMRPVVDRVFPFERVLEAFAYLESGAMFGKIGLEFAAATSQR